MSKLPYALAQISLFEKCKLLSIKLALEEKPTLTLAIAFIRQKNNMNYYRHVNLVVKSIAIATESHKIDSRATEIVHTAVSGSSPLQRFFEAVLLSRFIHSFIHVIYLFNG